MAGVRPPGRASGFNVGVARRSYQYGYQKGNSGTGTPKVLSAPKPLKTPAFKAVRVPKNLKSSFKDTRDYTKTSKQPSMTFGFGDTGITRDDEVL